MLAPPAGPAMTPELGRALVSRARALDLRVLGPAALALINTAEGVRLNVSPAAAPRPGVVGLFTQSAGVGTIMLAKALSMGLGLSTFLSTGSYADVTANDVMQFWAEDDRTQVCLLSLDRVGNPRKFVRILRELIRRKPVVVFTPSRALRSARWDHAHELPSAPAGALDQVIEATGAIVVSQRDEMFDVARILARQPVPTGRRVRVVSNSPGLVDQADAAAARWDLRSVKPLVVEGPDAVSALVAAARASLDDPETDAVLVGLVDAVGPSRLDALHAALEEIAAERPTKTLVGVFVGFSRPPLPTAPTDGPGHLPVFSSYADALRALALIIDGEARRTTPRTATADDSAPTPEGRARRVVDALLADAPSGREATDAETLEILGDYGLHLLTSLPVTLLAEATDAAGRLGWDVVLKATVRAARGRPDMPNVSRHLGDADELARAWAHLDRLAVSLGAQSAADIAPVVQRTVEDGTPLTVRAIEDRALGPMVCVGVAGPPAELLGDVAWRAAPIDRDEGFSMLGTLRAAPLLEGYRGSPPAQWFTIVDVLVRLSALKADLPEVVEVDFTPVLAGPHGTTIVGARLRVAPALRQRDPLARRAT